MDRTFTQHSGNRFIQRCIDVVSRLEAGTLTVVMPDGSEYQLTSNGVPRAGNARDSNNGDLPPPGPNAVIRVNRWRALRKFLTQGDFGFVESYMDGDWDSPELANVIELAVRNSGSWNASRLQSALHKFWQRLLHLMHDNSKRGSRRNIAAHYDLGNEFYKQWLDPTMTYSSAYFAQPGQSLSDAQTAKYRRIAEALDIRPDHHLLEIGCGWGGFAEFAVKEYGCKLTGLTLSKEQLKFASERLQREGLSEKVDFRLQDYRDVGGTFDRIASIEMFEAVGEQHWPRYFDTVRERLAQGGAAALQIITIAEDRFEQYRKGADFIQRYIFPGGMLPSVERLKTQFDRAKLKFVDATMFGDSYADTLRQWRDRFLAAWAHIEPLGFDERFRRMWVMYLAYCEGGFRGKAVNVGQFKLVRP
jgi:cyclopropane-fatty-acyl-phospholipid synthase